MPSPVTLFIDIDSTLVENRFSRRVIGAALAEIAAVSGKTVAEHGRELGQENERRQAADPDHALTMDWQDIVQQVAARYGVTLSVSVDALWQASASAAEIDVLDDAPAVLQRLRDDGHRLIIATKGLSKYQLPVLAAAGLLPYFDDILTPDNTGFLKTSPAYFDRVRAQLAGAGACFIHLGDHYYDDVICAKRNGFYSILRAPIAALAPLPALERPAHLAAHRAEISTYPAAGTAILPDAVVLSLAEVPALVPRLAARPC